MKRFTTTWIAAAVVVALIAFTFFDNKQSKERQAKSEKDQLILPMQAEEIQRIAISRSDGNLVLERDLSKPLKEWQLVEPVKDRADQQMLASFIEGLLQEKTVETVSEDQSPEAVKRFGLDDGASQKPSQLQVTARPAESTRQASLTQSIIKIGATKAYDGNLYAIIAGKKGIYLVSSAWAGHLGKSANEFRDKLLMRTELTEVGKVLLKYQGGPELRFEKSNDAWRATKGGDGSPIGKAQIEDFINKVKALRALDFAERNLNSTKLLAKPDIEIGFYRTANDTQSSYSLKIAKQIEKQPSRLSTSSDLTMPANLYPDLVEQLRKKAEDFYDRKAAFQFSVDEVKRLAIRGPEGKSVFEKNDGKWIRTKVNQAESLQPAIDGAKLDELLRKLSKLEALRHLGPKAQVSLKQETNLEAKNDKGDVIFSMSWGAPIFDKADSKRPEAKVIPVYTSREKKWALGVTEGSINELGLAGLSAATKGK